MYHSTNHTKWNALGLINGMLNQNYCAVLQLVMQYLYYGGTEALHIRNTEIMEVRESCSQSQ